MAKFTLNEELLTEYRKLLAGEVDRHTVGRERATENTEELKFDRDAINLGMIWGQAQREVYRDRDYVPQAKRNLARAIIQQNVEIICCNACAVDNASEELRTRAAAKANAEWRNVASCEDCGNRDWNEKLIDAPDRERVRICQRCMDRYRQCHHCDKWMRAFSFVRGEGYNRNGQEVPVCNDCRGTHYEYCSRCSIYFHPSQEDDHQHDSARCKCTSPHDGMAFCVRNGDNSVPADTRVTIELDAGEISPTGINEAKKILRKYFYDNYYVAEEAMRAARMIGDGAEIEKQRTIRDQMSALYGYIGEPGYGGSDMDNAIGATWETRQGKWTKRLSSAVYKAYRIKIPAEIITQVGNVLAAQISGSGYHVEYTRDLNQTAKQFFHEGSCWWQSYSYSRCILKSNGGFGMRTYSEPGAGEGTVTGRAWVLPLKLTGQDDYNGRPMLKQTFETENPAAYVVFNGYGLLEGGAAPRILARMTGLEYTKIGFQIGDASINNGGYLVASAELVKKYDGGRIELRANRHGSLWVDEAEDRATKEAAKAWTAVEATAVAEATAEEVQVVAEAEAIAIAHEEVVPLSDLAQQAIREMRALLEVHNVG